VGGGEGKGSGQGAGVVMIQSYARMNKVNKKSSFCFFKKLIKSHHIATHNCKINSDSVSKSMPRRSLSSFGNHLVVSEKSFITEGQILQLDDSTKDPHI
jgi:hypothetical protein